jgi:glycosyltransferase involved in cell wall biosynthesis
MTQGTAANSILYLVTEDWYFWSHRRNLALAAKGAGYHVIVATREGEYAERIRSLGFELVPVRMRRAGAGLTSELAAISDLVQIYRRLRPCIVHHIALKPVVYGAIAARFAGVNRVVSTVAGLGYLYVSGGFKVGWMRFVVQRVLSVLLNRDGQAVIVQNPDDQEQLVRSGVLDADRIVLIRGSGVDTSAYEPRPEPEDDSTIVFASRMLWSKGVGEFVEAARQMSKMNTPVRFVLAGRVDPDNPDAVSSDQLEEWHREGIVEWHGWIEDIRDILAQSHIVCLPSTYGEGVPKVLIEAAACGIAIVTTDTPGCREIVRDGFNGTLVPEHDPQALVESFKTLLENAELRNRYGRNGRQLVMEEFGLEAVNEAILAVYERLMSEGSPG